jgi:uncharacterized protein with GYD domain
VPTYLVLGHFTEQGVRNIKDSPKRAEAVRSSAKKLGITVKDMYWTMGQYDVAFIADSPDEASMASLGLSIGALGNVRLQTLRAFSADEIGQILGRVG